MTHRFFLPTKIENGIAILTGDQAHHAIHVMRFSEGDQILLFDGQGAEHQAIIKIAGKKELQLEVVKSTNTPRSVKRLINVVVAIPKGDRQKFLVEKLVEVGVSRLVPLKTSRSVAVVNAKVLERIRRQVIEASKQCERNYLMNVADPVSIEDLTNAESLDAGVGKSTLKLLAHPNSENSIGHVDSVHDQSVVIAIGPEGGFSEEEVLRLNDAGWQSVNLGPTILRIETAAIVAAVQLGIGRR